MSVGLTFLKKYPQRLLALQQNLQKNLCVTCGKVPLSNCDKQFGMCISCRKEISQTNFDNLFYNNKDKQ
jgi:hypothetical protein